MSIVYADNAASTQIRPEILAVMEECNQHYGNPSCIHSMGQIGKELINNARQQIATCIGAKPNEIVFTSGGTEANNLAIKGFVQANEHKGYHIITAATEHVSVLNTLKYLEYDGYEVTYLPVDSEGKIDLLRLYLSIRNNTILITIMFANNEIGAIQPIKEIADISRKYNICFHTDAIQALGHYDIDVMNLGVDMMSLSAHKIYGPKGIGALYVRDNIDLFPLLHGGGQEYNLRSGTENVQGIVGMSKAVELLSNSDLIGLKNKLTDGIVAKIPDVIINSPKENNLPNIVNVSFKDVCGRELIEMLSDFGVYVSTGSACSSSARKPSHVLKAIGVPDDLALGSVRFSFGIYNTPEDIDYILNILPDIVTRLRNKNY